MKSESEPFSNPQQPGGKSGKIMKGTGGYRGYYPYSPQFIKFGQHLQTNIAILSNYRYLFKKN